MVWMSKAGPRIAGSETSIGSAFGSFFEALREWIGKARVLSASVSVSTIDDKARPIEEISASELVRRCQFGDQDAQALFYTRYAPRVLGWAKRFRRPGKEPEDIVQEIFVAIFRGKTGFREKKTVDAWLYTITVHAARKRRRLIDGLLSFWAEPPDVPTAEASSDPLLAHRLQSALRKLPFEQQEVFVLMAVEERTAPEVAALLEVSEGTVRTRLRLAREKLAQALGDPKEPT